jgi:putative transposase
VASNSAIESASSAMLRSCTETLRSSAWTLVDNSLLALSKPRNSTKARTTYTLKAVARSLLRQCRGQVLPFSRLPSILSPMSRPLRIEFPNAIYHVTSRGDRREDIYRDDTDRQIQLDVLAHAMDRFDAQVLAYCQMSNHFHMVLHTRQANLSRLMRHVNGVYTQSFNRRHALVGHLFQGRFKAILVDRDAYLLTLCRYVERNPVAAGMVCMPDDWAWSSYCAHVGQVVTPEWLDSDGLHAYLMGQAVATKTQRQRAQRRYANLVAKHEPGDAAFWRNSLRGQIYLGDEDFEARMQAQARIPVGAEKEIPKVQRQQPRDWQSCLLASKGDRNQALALAYFEHGMTMTWLAQQSGLSVSHVSRVIARQEVG